MRTNLRQIDDFFSRVFKARFRLLCTNQSINYFFMAHKLTKIMLWSHFPIFLRCGKFSLIMRATHQLSLICLCYEFIMKVVDTFCVLFCDRKMPEVMGSSRRESLRNLRAVSEFFLSSILGFWCWLKGRFSYTINSLQSQLLSHGKLSIC